MPPSHSLLHKTPKRSLQQLHFPCMTHLITEHFGGGTRQSLQHAAVGTCPGQDGWSPRSHPPSGGRQRPLWGPQPPGRSTALAPASQRHGGTCATAPRNRPLPDRSPFPLPPGAPPRAAGTLLRLSPRHRRLCIDPALAARPPHITPEWPAPPSRTPRQWR